jgi:hypothetical protein
VAARDSTFDAGQRARADEIVQQYLGLIDGDAAVRTVAVLRDLVTQWELGRTPAVWRHRERLAGRRPALHPIRAARTAARRLRPRVGAILGR